MATRRTTNPSRNIPTLQPEVPSEGATPRKRTAKPALPKATPVTTPPQVEISADARRGMIAEAAYLRAERRGFASGYEVDDWVAAENEVDALLGAAHTRRPQ